MPAFRIAFIVNGHQEPLQGLDTLEIDKDKDVAALRDAILDKRRYARPYEDVKLWKVSSVNNIRARSYMSKFPWSSTTQRT
jgi:hypothetical protein